jgi:hypothetical protein
MKERNEISTGKRLNDMHIIAAQKLRPTTKIPTA